MSGKYLLELIGKQSLFFWLFFLLLCREGLLFVLVFGNVGLSHSDKLLQLLIIFASFELPLFMMVELVHKRIVIGLLPVIRRAGLQGVFFDNNLVHGKFNIFFCGFY